MLKNDWRARMSLKSALALTVFKVALAAGARLLVAWLLSQHGMS